jgi:hypothetical protein
MNHIKCIVSCTITITLSLGVCNLCSANTDKPLILKISPTQSLTFSQTETKSHTFEDVKPVNYDSKAIKKMKRAKRTLKKITSLRYSKKQKIRALLSKSSYVIQYTHTL